MARLTIDTEQDSPESIKKMIDLLHHFITEKTGQPLLTNTTNTSTTTSQSITEHANPFAMFNETTPTSTVEQKPAETPTTAAHNNDMFSMFSNDTPSTTPQNYGTSPSTITPTNNLSAQDLLREASFEGEQTEEKKKEQDFFQLMQY